MAGYGKIKPFNPSTDDWNIYQEKLFEANNIAAAKKRAILLTVCGDSTFKLLCSLVPDGKLDAEGVTYDSLVELLKGHYGQTQSSIVYRFHFNSCSRKDGESIADYVAALRELALNGTTNLLEEMLRDRLVCGVNYLGIQRKLLSEGELAYANALKLAQTVEASERDSKKLSGEDSKPGRVHFAKKGNYNPSGTPAACYRCGGAHLAPQCGHKDVVCRYCKKKGHFASVCRAKGRRDAQDQPPQEQ